ncbi:MAG: zinc ribbon domain-containing protein [Actinomycetota bacterium]|nr:zinc ribbon domain-containing protein [Actinomycetota bacterium]
MPIFEFDCLDCQKQFELLVGVGKPAGKNGRVCPACQSQNIKKRFSRFAARSTGGGQTTPVAGSSGCSSCSSSSCGTCGT